MYKPCRFTLNIKHDYNTEYSICHLPVAIYSAPLLHRPECVINSLHIFILVLLIPIFLPSTFLVLCIPFHYYSMPFPHKIQIYIAGKTNAHKRALYSVCINTTELLSRPRTGLCTSSNRSRRGNISSAAGTTVRQSSRAMRLLCTTACLLWLTSLALPVDTLTGYERLIRHSGNKLCPAIIAANCQLR